VAQVEMEVTVVRGPWLVLAVRVEILVLEAPEQ